MSRLAYEAGVPVPGELLESISGWGFDGTFVLLLIASGYIYMLLCTPLRSSSGMVALPVLLSQLAVGMFWLATPREFAADERPVLLKVMPWVDIEPVAEVEPKDLTAALEDGYGVKVLEAEWESADSDDQAQVLKGSESWDVTIQTRGEKAADCIVRALVREDTEKPRMALLCSGTEVDKSSEEGSA